MSATSDEFLHQFAQTRAFMLGRPSRIQLTAAGDAVLFLCGTPRSPVLSIYEYDVATGVARVLVTPEQILGGVADEPSEAEQAQRERMRITDRGFTWFDLSPDGRAVLLLLAGKLISFSRATGAIQVLVDAERDLGGQPILDPRFSPNGQRVAFVGGPDLFVVDADAGAPPYALTTGGSAERFFGRAEFVAQEEMHRFQGYWWSPTNDALLVSDVDESGVERFSLTDPARPERPPATFRYPRPGQANADVRLGLFPLDGGLPLWIEWDRGRYPYVARVLWCDGASPLTLLVQTRDQRETVLLAVDLEVGQTRSLVVERDEAWVNLEPDLPRWLPGGRGLLWATETPDQRRLELRGVKGTFERVLVGDDFLRLLHVAPDGAFLHVLMGGAVSNRIERVDVSSGTRVCLVDDGGDHQPLFSGDGERWVDVFTTLKTVPVAAVRDRDGRVLGTLPDSAEPLPFSVNVEIATVQGDRLYHAAIVRPRDFAPGKRYPVIVHAYGGPHALMVKPDARAYVFDQWLADHGAIVVCADNRGTPRRGRAWERAIKAAFGTVPVDDQADALAALSNRYPELDLARVGIYGWSFGGYLAALAVLRRPEVFHVAVAGAPVVDWRDYDTHYTERYLDLPNVDPEAYRSSSLLTYAGNLVRPLLLVHGTADDNVYFFHSLKLADALTRAGRNFDFLPLAGVTHQMADPLIREQVWAKMAGYLIERLGLTCRTGQRSANSRPLFP